MTEQELRYNVSLKGQGGYNDPAPWLTIEANTRELLKSELESLLESDVASLVAQAQSQFRDSLDSWNKIPSPPSPPSPPPAQQEPQPTGAPPTPAGQGGAPKSDPLGRTCKECGAALTYQTATGKTGKWEAYGCPNRPSGKSAHTMHFID